MVYVEILLGTWSNGSPGFSLGFVDVIGILYFIEGLYDGEYIFGCGCPYTMIRVILREIFHF
jgi:hypothetical protein